jgi:uncharacterized membrane protein YadS
VDTTQTVASSAQPAHRLENTPPAAAATAKIAGLLFPLVAFGVLAFGASSVVSLCLGASLALVVGNPYVAHARRLTQLTLALAIVGLGAGVQVRPALAYGAVGFWGTLGALAVCLVFGALLARKLRVNGDTALLIAVGTAICGGSAIATVSKVIGASDEETSAALGTVFLLNGVSLFLFPALAPVVGLDGERFGLWVAFAVHDTSSVIGAALAHGALAVSVATPVKLGRALLILPIAAAIGIWKFRSSVARPVVAVGALPWFLLGFLAMAVFAATVPSFAAHAPEIATGARRLMAVALFSIGASVTRESLRRLGPRALLYGLSLWIAVASISLLLLCAGVADL